MRMNDSSSDVTTDSDYDSSNTDANSHDDADGNDDDDSALRRQLLFHADEEETTIMRRHCALWNPHIGLYGAWDTQVRRELAKMKTIVERTRV